MMSTENQAPGVTMHQVIKYGTPYGDLFSKQSLISSNW